MVASNKSVLIVDNDVVILRLLRESLGAMLGCKVETTPDPEYAFELVLRKQYDLFVFDLLMPNIDGATLYNLILKVYDVLLPPDFKLPPLILISGDAKQRRAQELLKMPGVRAVVAKPFTLDRMAKIVEQALTPGTGRA